MRRTNACLFALSVALLIAGGCKKSTPAPPPGAEPAPSPLEVKREGKYLFTYVGGDGVFTTTDDPATIPPGARRLVRVTDPARAQDRRDMTGVHVVDVDEVAKTGKAVARVMSREAFETAALGQLPPGQSSLLAEGGQRGGPAAETPTDAGPIVSPEGAVVTIYGTSWCGACREARRYLSERKIPFADKDVEKDPAAARELASKAARLGVPADRVPVLEVRGRLLVGFDRARLDALLGEPT